MSSEVILAWDASPSPEAIGYGVYWGEESAVYSNFVDVGNVLTYTVTGLDQGQYWYFAVTAYANIGGQNVESVFSNELVVYLDFYTSYAQATFAPIYLPTVRHLSFNF